MGSDVYKRQIRLREVPRSVGVVDGRLGVVARPGLAAVAAGLGSVSYTHLDAADERSSVDLGGRRIIKKKKCRTRGCRPHDTKRTHTTTHTRR